MGYSLMIRCTLMATDMQTAEGSPHITATGLIWTCAVGRSMVGATEAKTLHNNIETSI